MPREGKPINTIGKQFSLLIKPTSADCNLNCEYCFYHQRPTDPYKSDQIHKMGDEVLLSMISQYLNITGQYGAFSWQGGEPLLMGIDFFKKVVSLQQVYGYRGQYVGNSVQTNATLINDDFAKLFHEYNFLLGVSLDGPSELHEYYRGKGTFQKVMDGINILRNHKVEFNILSVVNDQTAQKADVLYKFFLENKFYYLQFIPAVEFDRSNGQPTDFSVNPKDYGNFLCQLFDLWYNNGNPAISIRTFDNIATIYAGIKSEACIYMKECGNYAVIEYNGDVYPCDFFVEEPLLLGNILETPLKEIISSQKMRDFSSQKCNFDIFEDCKNCAYEFICHCGCPHYRYNNEMDYLCPAYKQFFAYTESRFRVLANRIKIQYAYQNQQSKFLSEKPQKTPERNDPCPCGSGKKYKKCCMLK
ncbi:TPA: anaerobic sulfatase maturase [Candidatus Poribacteria bacterium]|nr:anaerobic sulfatase maturase [Candidatus Poribacteria bacterium]